MKRTLFLLFMIVAMTAGANAQEQPILVDVQWLKEHQNDPNLVLLEIAFLKFEYDSEHIPGARYLWPGSLTPDSPYGAYNMPEEKKATEILQGLGVSNNSHIVLYHVRNEVSVTARIFLTLENLGLRGKVSFLNGGLDAWKKSGLPVTKDLPVVKTGNVKLKTGALLVDKDGVLKDINTGSGIIVDARMQRFYDGEPTGNPRNGHITGAKNIPYTEMVDEANMFKSNEVLKGYFTPVIPDKSKEVVTYCFIGQTASVVYMAGRILGYDMKLYDGSLQEWSRIESLPMEVTKK